MSGVDLEDVVEALEDIRDAIKKAPQPAAPVVHVAAPEVSVAAPVVNVSERKPHGWLLTVVSRDEKGNIKQATLTPE